jgi:hypothetical protein
MSNQSGQFDKGIEEIRKEVTADEELKEKKGPKSGEVLLKGEESHEVVADRSTQEGPVSGRQSGSNRAGRTGRG